MSHHYHIIHRSQMQTPYHPKITHCLAGRLTVFFYFCIQYNYNLTDAFNKFVQDVNLQRFINHQTFKH